jgi:hypothetical protein
MNHSNAPSILGFTKQKLVHCGGTMHREADISGMKTWRDSCELQLKVVTVCAGRLHTTIGRPMTALKGPHGILRSD